MFFVVNFDNYLFLIAGNNRISGKVVEILNFGDISVIGNDVDELCSL